MFQSISSIAVFPLGTWGVHKYVAFLKQALPRGAPTHQPLRNAPQGCSSNFFFFFFTIVGALLVGGSEVLKVYAKIVKFLVYLGFCYVAQAALTITFSLPLPP